MYLTPWVANCAEKDAAHAAIISLGPRQQPGNCRNQDPSLTPGRQVNECNRDFSPTIPPSALSFQPMVLTKIFAGQAGSA